MAQAMDYVEYLSREIGARPAGTEEEEQAALYIADEFQKETGFSAVIEEFTSSANLEGGRAILSMVTIVASVLAMLFNVLTAPMFVLALIAAIIYVMESYGKPVFSNRLARVPSQNVVAKYQPAEQPQSGKRPQRKRKIVLVAHYDTGKVTPKIVERVESMGLPLPKVCLWGMVAAAFFLLLRIFLGGTGGVGLIFINILTVIAIIIVALPIVKAVLYRSAAYNEGANNNATGVAALLEVAKRISSGSLSEADLLAEQEAAIHGADEAWEQGLVPEGAQLTYEVEPDAFDDEEAYSEEERLLAAKAAIAALTGRPIEQVVYGDVSSERPVVEAAPIVVEQPAQVADEPVDVNVGNYAEVSAASFATVAAAEPVEEEVETGFENAPSWFVSAQKNAKRSEVPVQVQRSRYTEAIQATERELAERERAREEEERLLREQQRRERDVATRAALAAMHGEAEEAGRAEQFGAALPVENYATAAPAFEFEPAVEAQSVYEGPAALKPNAEPEPASVAQELPESEETPVFEEVTLPENWEDWGEAEIEPTAADKGEVAAQSEEAVIEEPGRFEERVQSEVVDLGQTIAYTPEMIREAIRAEMAEQRAADEELANPRASLGRIAAMDIPEAEEEAVAQIRAREQLASLPTLEESEADPSAVPENGNPSRSGLFRMLRSDVPSISGSITAQPQPEPAKVSLESAALPKIVLEEDGLAGDYDIQLSVSDELEQAVESAETQLLDPVDEDFAAREVDRELGSWESSGEERSDDQNRTWEGGAFSRLRLGHVSTRSGEDETADEPEELAETAEDQQLNEEIEQIYHFRNPDFSTEVWFVAIGSDDEYHDGAKAFLAEHKADLRGAMVVEVESLGVGELCVASEEGSFRKLQASSRIKRFTRGATEATGIALGQVKTATDSITTILQAGGVQAMHLMGVEEGRPALKGSADDIIENVDEMLLEENIDYIAELLKQE